MKAFAQTLLMAHLALGLSLSAAEPEVAKPATVAYRVTKPKTIHFDAPAKARTFVEAVKKLGCQARIEDHGDHLDVSFNLAMWKSITLTTEESAHRWEDWMKRNGFETIHAHGENDSHSGHNHGGDGGAGAGGAAGHSHDDGHDHSHVSAEVLTYSVSRWQTLHARNPGEEDQLVAILKGLGCDVRTDAHEEHSDIVFQCPQPKHLELPSHRVASDWEKWLQQKGFRTEHAH